MTPQEFGLDAIKQLDVCPIEKWAELFVNLKMQFARQFDSLCSTSHGTLFFQNLMLPKKYWKEKGYLGDNFRKHLTKEGVEGHYTIDEEYEEVE